MPQGKHSHSKGEEEKNRKEQDQSKTETQKCTRKFRSSVTGICLGSPTPMVLLVPAPHGLSVGLVLFMT